MKIVETIGDDSLARVYVAELEDGALIEFVESVQPPIPREEKWVLIVSTLKGCPVACSICDAGSDYKGKLTSSEIFGQIDHLIRRRFPGGSVPVPKLKIQFARMGEPAFNSAVLTVLEELPKRYDMPGLIPCLSTVAPAGCDSFFERLLAIKNSAYLGHPFQLQFSLHTTDPIQRKQIIPARSWSFEQIAEYGERFHRPGERKITLNFAPAQGLELDPQKIRPLFSPDTFLVKLTPINPTHASHTANLSGVIDWNDKATCEAIAQRFRSVGYETLISMGERREDEIGSNCGMAVTKYREQQSSLTT